MKKIQIIYNTSFLKCTPLTNRNNKATYVQCCWDDLSTYLSCVSSTYWPIWTTVLGFNIIDTAYNVYIYDHMTLRYTLT